MVEAHRGLQGSLRGSFHLEHPPSLTFRSLHPGARTLPCEVASCAAGVEMLWHLLVRVQMPVYLDIIAFGQHQTCGEPNGRERPLLPLGRCCNPECAVYTMQRVLVNDDACQKSLLWLFLTSGSQMTPSPSDGSLSLSSVGTSASLVSHGLSQFLQRPLESKAVSPENSSDLQGRRKLWVAT